MPKIPSSLVNADTAVNRNIDNSAYDNIAKVASAIDDVITVSNDLELGSGSKITQVLNNLSPISAVADNITNVNLVASHMEVVNNSIDDISLVSDQIGNINVLASNMDNINIDANNIGSIIAVGTDLKLAGWSDIYDAGSLDDIVTSESTGISLIKTVADSILDVNTTATNISSVITTATNIASIISVAPHIVDIQNAEENANIAINKASEASVSATSALADKNLAHKWANELEDVPVIGTYGVDDEYSAYHWAKKAESIAGGSITLDSLYDVNTAGITQGGMIRYDESTGWIAYDFTKNDKLGFDLTGSNVSTGELAWNPDEGTLDVGLNNGSVLQVGQENVRLVRNSYGLTIANGTVCMFDGAIGNSGRIKVVPYTGIKGTELYVYGVATQDILPGEDGYITIEGKVRGINTTGSSVGETWLDGDILYAKPNDTGKLTKVVPSINELKLEVASVIKAHSNGVLEIRLLPLDRNFSYSQAMSDSKYVPLGSDFILDLGGL